MQLPPTTLKKKIDFNTRGKIEESCSYPSSRIFKFHANRDASQANKLEKLRSADKFLKGRAPGHSDLIYHLPGKKTWSPRAKGLPQQHGTASQAQGKLTGGRGEAKLTVPPVVGGSLSPTPLRWGCLNPKILRRKWDRL